MTEIVEHRDGDAARLTAADARRRGGAALKVLATDYENRENSVIPGRRMC